MLHLLLQLVGLPGVAQAWPGSASRSRASSPATRRSCSRGTARDLWQSAMLLPQLLVPSRAGRLRPVLGLWSAGPRRRLRHRRHASRWPPRRSPTCCSSPARSSSRTRPSTPASRPADRSLARPFRAGVALMAVGLLAPWLGLAAIPCVLVGLALYEHAYVQAAQAVPLS
ncbi:MAG: hypothetical protein R3F30_09275 [Planctomycetota bacterium]